MSNRIMLATLALGAAVAFAGPAFADKMKATLDGKTEVPPNASAGTGTADIDYDPASKKLSWKVTYSGLSGPATAAHFHGPAEAGKNAGVAVPIAPIIWLTAMPMPSRSPGRQPAVERQPESPRSLFARHARCSCSPCSGTGCLQGLS